MRFRTRLLHTLAATLIVMTAMVAVGLTAPANAAFAIRIRPVFATLGIDVDVKPGTMHLHLAWSAIPSTPSSTKPADPLF